MVDLIYEKYRENEAGFLLLDSLATLIIIMVVILLMNPLMTHWLADYSKAKELVEQNRILYENTMEQNNQQLNEKGIEESGRSTKKKGAGISVYEVHFEYETNVIEDE